MNEMDDEDVNDLDDDDSHVSSVGSCVYQLNEPSSGFAPLSPWVEQRCPQLMELRIPMVLCKAPVVGFGSAMAGLLVWVCKKRRIKKQRDGQALDLGGHQSMTITNNQQIVGRSGRGDVWVQVRGWESVWGATVPLFGAASQTMKKIFV
jgi:hypothetical protein